MRGTKTTINKLIVVSLLSLTAATCLPAASTDYFPLQPGNSWAYRVTRGRNVTSSATINVGDAVQVDGRQYYRLEYFSRNLLVRQADDGNVMQYNTDTKAEAIFLPLALADIQPAVAGVDNCTKAVASVNRAAKITTPLGDFTNALEIRYTPSCADAGVIAQYFLPWIGLIHQEESSIAGPVIYDLIYSHTGNTIVEGKNLGFTLALDGPRYQSEQDPLGLARLTLRASEAVKLTFPSGQTYDLRITNEKGESLYVWSADKLFPQVIREEQAGPGERTWVIEFPVGQFPAGKYNAEAWLTTQPRQYSATVAFEVR